MNAIAQAAKPAPPLALADVDRLADEIAEVASNIDAATHRLLTLIRRFDEGSGWAQHGALSCAHWLNWRIVLDLGAARERVRVARALGELPVLDDALRRGVVSYSKVRAITRVASAETEATLLDMARHATASQLERICRGYRRALTNLDENPESLEDEEQRRFVRVSNTQDGMVRIEAQLRPEEAAVVMQALDVARRLAWRDRVSAETPPHAPPRRASNVRTNEPRTALAHADAFVAVAETYLSQALHAGATPRAGAAPVELVVHVDAPALLADLHAASRGTAPIDMTPDDPTPRRASLHAHATLDDGTAIGIATAQRFACDSTVVTVTEDQNGSVQALSGRTRRISATLRRALRLRDDRCRFPGCTNRLTDAHHILAWAHGGRTHLTNLCSLCRRHHRLVHEHGYRIERTPTGDLRFFRRDGIPLPAADEDRSLHTHATDAFAKLRNTHAASGLEIDDGTAFPLWNGERVDHDLVVQALVSRGSASAP